ncbi:RNase adapter RapZ [Christensenella timonensis]|uniref:RNase adapter RapZ n=1 Tax=Christensenella timonensis TaxID=1816678 RepID=UPI00082C2190|nr:RNase adapter RapZ [Christensenella timonensis]
MKFTIVTGLSGAGRSSALKRLEDLGYYCVDNLMPELIPQFARLCMQSQHIRDKVAVAVDTRMGDFFDSIYATIDELKSMDLELDILFLDASDAVLVKRFKEVRRKHPVSGSGEILAGIHLERRKLQQIKDMANHVIDTSSYNVMKLRQMIDLMYAEEGEKGLLVSIISFGYKRGIPLDADMVFDMRFIPNPFYVEGMRDHTGLEQDVRDFVLSFEPTKFFLHELVTIVEKLAPCFISEDKNQLVIGIGCTGGMHRSVVMAEELFRMLSDQGLRVTLEHRDINLEKNR